MKPELITAGQAIAALPNCPMIHCFAGSIGADWKRESVVEELSKARRIAWAPNVFKHELAVEAGPTSEWFGRSVLRFDVRKPNERQEEGEESK